MSRFTRNDLVRITDARHPMFDTTFTVATVLRGHRDWLYHTAGLDPVGENQLTLADKERE